jgi:hypothetical protein
LDLSPDLAAVPGLGCPAVARTSGLLSWSVSFYLREEGTGDGLLYRSVEICGFKFGIQVNSWKELVAMVASRM